MQKEDNMKEFKFSTMEYVRPDMELLGQQLDEFTQQIKSAKTYQEVHNIILKQDEICKEPVTMMQIAYIRNTLNTTDEFYENEVEYSNMKEPELDKHSVAFSKALLESPFRDEIDREFGTQYLVGCQLHVDSFKEELIPYLQKQSKLTTEYQKLMATAKIPFQGEILNLYGIQKYFQDDNRDVRKAAFKAYSDFYHENEETMECIFAELVEVRDAMGKALGYENFIPLGYQQRGRTDYGQEEVASFRQQVLEEIVPLCQKLYEAQAKRIGVNELKVYDEAYIFPDGNAVPIGDEDELVEKARKMYHDLCPETGEFIEFMLEHELMDLKNKENKASTGYMTSLQAYAAPFVFSCFNHTTFDTEVLCHELGHAFAGYQAMRHQPISDYFSSSTDIAEIHSMSMEQFAYPYAELFYGEAADKYRFGHLMNAITFVPFGVAVDEFQHIMYAHPELTPKERTYEWRKLEKKYMPWRVYEDDEFMERGGYWYHKLHIFLYPFYYINYTLTTMGAMEFKKRFEMDREEALADYIRLCNAGGSLSYLKLLDLAHLSNPFLSGGVKNAVSYAKEILLKEIEKENK